MSGRPFFSDGHVLPFGPSVEEKNLVHKEQYTYQRLKILIIGFNFMRLGSRVLSKWAG